MASLTSEDTEDRGGPCGPHWVHMTSPCPFLLWPLLTVIQNDGVVILVVVGFVVRGRCRVVLRGWLLRAVRAVFWLIKVLLLTAQPLLCLIDNAHNLQTKKKVRVGSSKYIVVTLPPTQKPYHPVL